MKIANIIITSENGGAEQVFIDYAAILKKLGHDVVVVIKQDAPYAEDLLKLGIEPKKITNHLGFHDFVAVKKLRKIFEEENIDVVFAHTGRAIILARKAIKKITNKKIFLIGINHSMNVKRSIGCDIILSVNKKIFYKTIDAGQSAAKSFVIANALDLSDANLTPLHLDLAQKSEISLGIIGRLDPTKGFHHVIDALNILKNSDKKFSLKIAGLGEEEKFLRNKVKQLKLEDRVEFLGWVKDKKEFYDSIDILLFPSLLETFGLVAIEAMKYRKPIISSDADGPKEILRDGIDALIFKFGKNDEATAAQIAEKILQLVGDSNLANNMVQNSFIRLNEKFSYQTLENRLGEIVGKIQN